MNLWHPHTEQPESSPTTAIIAEWDDDTGGYLLSDIHYWNGNCWINEHTLEPVIPETFWWALESDLMTALGQRIGRPEAA